MEPVIEAGWDETAYLERDPVLMKQFADDKKGLTRYVTFTEEEWEAYNEKPYTKTAYTEAEDGPFWNEANQQYLRKAIADVEAGQHCHAHSLIMLDDDED
jgi:hypothetical protein